MKTICIYHSIDLDGWMSAAIVKKWWLDMGLKAGHHPNNVWDWNRQSRVANPNITDNKDSHYLIMLGFNYGDDLPDLSNYDKVIMCDISFPAYQMKLMNIQYESNFIWIDHHISAINDVNDMCNPEGLRNTKYAACELTWIYFFPNQEMPEIVRMLGRYDCFGHKGTDEEQEVLEFQYAARTVISNYKHAYYYLNSYLEGDTAVIEALPQDGSAIYQYLCTEAKQSYKNGFEINIKEISFDDGSHKGIINRKFICINKERFNPINFGIDYHKEGYDGAACFHYANGMYNFSLYNDNGKVDCSVIAKQFGGGGHAGAAGFRSSDLGSVINS